MKLKGKVAVITGASRGIGRALTIALAQSECKLLLTALENNELAAVAEYVKTNHGAVVESMPANLTDESERQQFLEWIKSRDIPPDILVNNAGGGQFGRFDASRPEDIERTLNLNIHVPTALIHALIPILRTRPQAKIVNVSSGIARLPYPGLAVYGAAKGYMSSLSESLACELAGTGVSVLCFHPGFTDTQFMASAGMDMKKVPKFLVHTPEMVARRIVRSIRTDKSWVYSDLSSRLGVFGASCLPGKVRIRLFKNLFWKLPYEK